ncbi:MAG: hypothetical protein ACRDZZ_04590 [Ilumatobacteraceae bacterium]
MSARPFRSVLVVLAAIGCLAACNSTPSARRVALDVIDTLDVGEQVKECMREKVEAMSKDDVDDFAKGANEDPPDPEAQAALDQFEADLAACRSEG